MLLQCFSGMIGSGIFSYLFGIARSYEIHNLWYFIFVQIFAGIFQTTGWPGVVTVVGNWFGKGKRGLIFGIWNSHTSVGNILGSVIAAEFVETDWGLSFIIPGLIIAFGGFVIFLFLVAHPSHITYQETDSSHPKALDRHSYQPVESEYSSDSESGLDELCAEDAQLIYGRKGDAQSSLAMEPSSPTPAVTTETTAVGFLGACRIPGVIEYSACLFFGKLVSYTFLYWLPLYIGSSTSLSASLSADLSTVFDFGGILGGIACGVLSDYTGKSAVVCSVMLIFAVPMVRFSS
ncbi:glucose-6-phosphate exchanger SLC37A2 [Bacillus rossius redtenbacheri]|uniref:glucose-6-phosphate exchanger SLC37A2 n=1 Tax=Bacillus rossius redtenbacheri TaxID=93214 RepID=UPI002FDEC381